jgi:hypothetical protein
MSWTSLEAQFKATAALAARTVYVQKHFVAWAQSCHAFSSARL